MNHEAHYNAEGDQTTVWVHLNGECVARFGKVACEIFSVGEPRSMEFHAKSPSLDTWLAFKERVLAVHGFPIEDSLTPHRFHEELGLEPSYAHQGPVFEVPLSSISRLNNPFRTDVWGRGRVTRKAVQDALDRQDFAASFVPDVVRKNVLRPGWDARRIAYFVAHPDRSPLSVEVTSTGGAFNIDDGWHRLGAAIFRADKSIHIELGGYHDGWEVSFPKRIPVNQVAQEIKRDLDIDGVIAKRLELARACLGWTQARINAFLDGLSDFREGKTNTERLTRHDRHSSPFIDEKCTADELDGLGYRDGVRAGEALAIEPRDYDHDELGMMAEVNAWATNGNGDFDIDEASWAASPAYDIETFFAVMSRDEWIAWFIEEDRMAKEVGRYGYADLLIQDIHQHVVHALYDDGRVDVWDGFHRIGAAMLKGEAVIPAIEGRPAPAPALNR